MTEPGIFVPEGGGYVATSAARGPWSPDAAHGGAPSALLAGIVERLGAEAGMRPASLHFTFFGEVPVGPVLTVSVTREKPGRRQQVVAADLVAGDRTVLRLRAVLLRRNDVALPAGVGARQPTLPPADAGTPPTASFVPARSVGFASSGVEIRFHPLVPAPTGPPAFDAWFRLRLPIVAGEATTSAQRACAAADFGNGISEPLPFADYLFVNCDLYLAWQRDPEGEWVGIRARTEVDRVGAGVTSTELHDAHGRFGTAVQTLFVDRR